MKFSNWAGKSKASTQRWKWGFLANADLITSSMLKILSLIEAIKFYLIIPPPWYILNDSIIIDNPCRLSTTF